jgi:hypothetical protein
MTEELQSGMPRALRDYWVRGEGAAKIRWGTEGDFTRCVRAMRGEGVRDPEGTCANLHHEATGKWPAEGKEHSLGAFAAQVHTGAMIALVPSAPDAQRLAMDGGEALEEMHLTLCYLGDANQWTQAERLEMAAGVAHAVSEFGPIRSEAFALSYFNPGDNGRDTALVYGIGGGDVANVYQRVCDAVPPAMRLKIPEQHSPFAAHVTAKYTDNLDEHRGLVDRLGPTTFDRVRLAFGGEHYDIELYAPDLDALVASMGIYSPVTWSGPLAPIGSPTGDKRIFPPGTLTYQTFPMPLRFQRRGMPGHEGAVTVGRILHAEEREYNGKPYIMGSGDWFNPDIIPEVTEAMALVEGGVSGPSVDLDSFAAGVVEYNGKPILAVHEGRIRGATLVSIPAFADLRLELQYPEPVDEPVETGDAGINVYVGDAELSPVVASVMVDESFTHTYDELASFASVNATGWKGAPIAPRDAEFDADDAVSRIELYAGVGGESPDESKMRKMFLWIDPEGAPLDRAGYRLPWGDIIDGKPYLIYHAIYAAAALLEGGHGGLPNIPDADKARLRSVISDIYAKLAVEFGDPNIQASWDRAQEKADKATKASAVDTAEFKYTESKHPRDPSGEDGGEWVDVPGHGPHGEITSGGKKSGGGDSKDKGSGGSKGKDSGGSKEPKGGGESKGSDFGTRAKNADSGEKALNSAPAKLKRAEGGHGGKYGDESLDAPEGAGSARALAEMEGSEYQETNAALWGDARLTDATKERIAEVDKTMAVSKLPKDAVVYRGIKDGKAMFGGDWIAPGLDKMSFDEEDAAYERYEAGERPDLTGYQWTQKSYLHTTVNKERLTGYAKKIEGAGLEPVAMTILLPKGTGAVNMSGMDFEAELMARRGLKLRVARDNGYINGVRHLDIEVVDDGD